MEHAGVRFAFLSGLIAVVLAFLLTVTPGGWGATVAQTVDQGDTLWVPGDSASTTEGSASPASEGGTMGNQENSPYSPAGSGYTASQDSPSNVQCPLRASDASRPSYVIDFTENGTVSVADLTLVANAEAERAERHLPLPTHIPSGTYKVSLASFDDHLSDTSRWYEQNREQWRLELYGTGGELLLGTLAIRDIANMESSVSETFMSPALINGTAASARAKHDAFPDPYSTQELAPLCALLERVGDVPSSEQPKPLSPSTEMSMPTNATSTATSTSQTQLIVPEQEYVRCPISSLNGRIVIDFTHNGTVPVSSLTIVANGLDKNATRGRFSTVLNAGKYKVRLASYASPRSPSVPGQQWYARLFDAAGQEIARTPSIRDVPDGESEYVNTVSDSFTIDREARAISAVHALYPSSDGQPAAHAVLCAAFDLVEPIVPEEEPKEEVKESEVLVVPATQSIPLTTVNTPATTTAPKPAPVVGEAARTPVIPKTITKAPEPIVREQTITAPPLEPRASEQESEGFIVEREVPQDPLFIQLNSSGQSSRADIIASFANGTAFASTGPHVLITRSLAEEGVFAEGDDSLATQQESFRRRADADSVRDTDGDGVSDYDEVHLYGTDPENPATAGGPLGDGARVLLGFDPLSTSYEAVRVESPKVADVETSERHRVFKISYASSSPRAATDTPHALVRVEGFAEPLSFVTLYLFSSPVIVTVRTDEVGMFTYEFDETLQDGSHEVYVTTVNRSGRIVAKSEPFAFVKTAEAIEFTAPTETYDPVDDVARKMVIIIFVLIGIFGTAGLVIVGIWRTHSINTMRP